MAASRVRRTLLTAIAVLAVGGGIAAYVHRQRTIERGPDGDGEVQASRLFSWGRFHVASFRVESARTTFSASCKASTGCRLTAPIAGPADVEATQALLDNVSALRLAREIATGEEARAKLAEYDLAPAPITFTASTTDGKQHVLYIGAVNAVDGRRHVAGGDPLRLGLADDTFHWAFDRDLFAFRAKQVFTLARDAISEITVERKGDAPRLLRLAKGGPSGWTVEGDGRKLPADPFVMDRFLVLLTRDLKADAFVTDAYAPDQAARYGLDKPAFEVTVSSADGRVDRAFVGVGTRPPGTGDPSEEGQAAPFVHLEGASTVSVVYNALLSDLDKGVPEFRDHRVTDFDLEDVRRIEVLRQGKPPFVLDGAGTSWRLISPESGPARTDRAQAIAMRFSKLRAARVVAEEKTPEAMRAMGLEPPELQVILRAEGGRILADIRFGKPVDKETVHVTAEGVERIDAIRDAELRLLPLTVDDIVRRGAP